MTVQQAKKEYGFFDTMSAITYIMEAGKQNFTAEAIEQEKKEILDEDAKIKAKGNIPIISAEYQFHILDIAYKLAQLPTSELMKNYKI